MIHIYMLHTKVYKVSYSFLILHSLMFFCLKYSKTIIYRIYIEREEGMERKGERGREGERDRKQEKDIQ